MAGPAINWALLPSAQYTDIQNVLDWYRDPQLVAAYMSDIESDNPWGGKGLTLSQDDIGERGLVRSYDIMGASIGAPMGTPTIRDAVAGAGTMPGFTSIRLPISILNTIEATREYDERAEDFIKKCLVRGITDVAGYVQRLAIEGTTRAFHLLSVGDRQGTLGDITVAVTAGTITTDATNSRYTFDLCFGSKTTLPLLEKGMLIQVCAAQSTMATGITTLRNYSFPIRIEGYVRPASSWNSTTKTCYTVKCAAYYGTTDASSVLTQLETIISTDRVGIWKKASSGTTDITPTAFNKGLCGLRFWWETDGSGTFANIEDIGGHITTGLTTDETTPRAVSRNTTEFEHLNPLVIEGAGASIGTLMGDSGNGLDDIFLDWSSNTGALQNGSIVVGNLMFRAMRRKLGSSRFQIWEGPDLTDAMKKRAQAFGTTSFAYQGESAEPIVVTKSRTMPNDAVMVTRDGEPIMGCLMGTQPDFIRGDAGAVFRRIMLPSGETAHGWQTTYRHEMALFPKKTLRLSMAVIRNVVPSES